MSKKIVFSFPGSRGCEIPLLYFGAKHYEDLGYEKIFLEHYDIEDDSAREMLEKAEKVIRSIDLEEYEEIVFIAKSIGTVIACKIKEKYHIPASLILLTPLNETLPYINKENDILLVAAGDKDKYLDAEILRRRCMEEGINCHIEPGVGHRMEVQGNLQRNLEIVSNVMTRIP